MGSHTVAKASQECHGGLAEAAQRPDLEKFTSTHKWKVAIKNRWKSRPYVAYDIKKLEETALNLAFE